MIATIEPRNQKRSEIRAGTCRCTSSPDVAHTPSDDPGLASEAMASGAAGLLLSNQFFLTPNDGGALMLKAYIAVAIGGWGSLRGAMAGALLIAFFEVFVATWLSQPIAEAGLYLALFAVLLLRPQGLFGEPVQRRA